MKDCLKKVLEEGWKGGNEVRRSLLFWLPGALKMEGLKLENCKQILSEWNRRCGKPIPSSKVRQRIMDAAGWVFKQRDTFAVGCKKLREAGLCVQDNGRRCKFAESRRRTGNGAREAQRTHERQLWRDWKEYLRNEFPYGENLIRVREALTESQAERGLMPEDPILAGVRTIAAKAEILGKNGHMKTFRSLKKLQELCLIQKVIQGSTGKGSGKGKANGYVLLPLPPVPRYIESPN